MPLNKLENFIKNTEGRILYVSPSDLDATDAIENQGNSLTKPFKTIQRALIEAARFSYLRGNDNDEIEGFVVSTGEIVQHRLTPPELHSIDQVASAASRNDIGKITLRCSLDPELQPTIQRRLDKALRDVDGSKSFMVDIDLERGTGSHKLYIICKEN